MVAVGVVLAAGGSTRMGRPKMLLPFGSGTLLAAAVAPLLASGLERVVVVLGCEADRVLRGAGLPAHPRLAVVVNPGWREGLAASLRCGLAACDEAEAVVVSLGDRPGVSPDGVDRLLAAWRGGARLAAGCHAGRVVHPVLFDLALFPELRELRGDVGAREVVRRHREEAALVEVGPVWDVDREDDYRALLEGRQPGDGEGIEW
jgi:molybdenum cofactor cytidylyltransferase